MGQILQQTLPRKHATNSSEVLPKITLQTTIEFYYEKLHITHQNIIQTILNNDSKFFQKRYHKRYLAYIRKVTSKETGNIAPR